MHAFDVLGDPVRRRILEILAQGEHTSGEVVEVISREFGITQSAVSQHLRVLRDAGLVTDSRDGSRRVYRVDPHGVAGMREYLDRFWSDALAAFESAAKTEEDP